MYTTYNQNLDGFKVIDDEFESTIEYTENTILQNNLFQEKKKKYYPSEYTTIFFYA